MSAYNYNIGLCFQDVTSRFGNRRAIVVSGMPLSYTELNIEVNRIAHYLLLKGMRKGQVIAIFNNKSATAYACILACLKIGVLYTNVDFTSPWERVQKILERCKPVFILDDNSGAEILSHIPANAIINIGTASFQEEIAAMDAGNPACVKDITGSDPAYIMFTSGSTGFPKGAVMSHQNVINFVNWAQATFAITHEDVFTNVNQIYFDNSVFDIYCSLLSGAALVPVHTDGVKDPKSIVKTINDSGCTIWFSVPSMLVYLLTTKALAKEDFTSIRRVLFGGEGFPKSKLKQLFTLYGDRMELHNVYGPTECTCICSSYRISTVDFENMNELAPLGFLAPNFSYYLISEDDEHAGELVLGGPNVGLGYYNDPERTAAAFVTRPGHLHFEWCYRTGDLVRVDEHGHLHFKGRADNQVKHMGYRIELEEIEAGFNAIPYVNEVGVIYEKMGEGLGQIKAFLSINDPAKKTADLQADIKKILPAYMVPRIIVILDNLPKNKNGKIDRKQLALNQPA
ncbi:MAG TPA: amino acid adenylation domain-containing protein [Bacteroidia bacterium]|nr:amino acid adenylation domain-containing protein [Bacteroidia bacterium]